MPARRPAEPSAGAAPLDRPGLLLIDLQRGDAHPDCDYVRRRRTRDGEAAAAYYLSRIRDRVLPSVARLQAAARDAGRPVIFVRIQSLTARTQAARRRSRCTMTQYSAATSATGGVTRSSSGSPSPTKHGTSPRPAPARIAASCIGMFEARSATAAPVSRNCCCTQREVG